MAEQSHWTYTQTGGFLIYPWHEKLIIVHSGNGFGENNPGDEHTHLRGPLPRGDWEIIKPAYDDDRYGEMVMELRPLDHEAHGRCGFFLRGEVEGLPSEGCLIVPLEVRKDIAASEITLLRVHGHPMPPGRLHRPEFLASDNA